MNSRRCLMLFVVALLGLGSESLSAQAIRGVVLDDELGRGVSNATVRLVFGDSITQSVQADTEGLFFLPLPFAGQYQLEVARFGYRSARSQLFPVERSDTLSVEFRLLPEAILVRPLLVTARSNQGRNLFDRRRLDWGRGVFLTPEDIDALQPRHPGDVFRDMEDVWLSWGWGRYENGTSGPVPRVRTFKGSGCLNYMIDRMPVNPTWGGWQLQGLNKDEIVAVEVYRHPAEIPPELQLNAGRATYSTVRGFTRVTDRLCGLVVYWTKSAW